MSLLTANQVGAAMTSDESPNKAIVQKAFDAWAAGTGSPYDLLATDVKWTITGNSAASKTYPGRDPFISEVIKPFNARMSVGHKPAIGICMPRGDTVVVFFDAAGTAKDGKPYKNTYAWFLDLQDGKIVNASAFLDSIAFKELWKLPPTAP
nr:nuclear transport factor 2 family protein [Rhizobium cauense]